MMLSGIFDLREFEQFLAHLVDTLGLINGFPSQMVQLPFKLVVFHAPGQVSLSAGPSVISLLNCWLLHWEVWLPSLPCLLLSYPFFVVPLLHTSCSVSPQFFFRRNCSVCRDRVSVSMGGGEFRVFLRCRLGPLALCFFFFFHPLLIYQRGVFLKSLIIMVDLSVSSCILNFCSLGFEV